MKTKKINYAQFPLLLLVTIILTIAASCSKGKNKPSVAMWLTTPDQSKLFEEQQPLKPNTETNTYPTIQVNPSDTFQTMDGFGYTVTGGSASLIHSLNNETRSELLKELFGTDGKNIGVSYLRISIGASDLSATDFTYDEMPEGETDINLDHFSIEMEKTDLIPILKEILEINPEIKILGSPWTPPTWMKTNRSFVGGSLKPDFYPVYANYFVKYIRAMAAEGIIIDAITVQNEPLHPGNNPSLLMQATEQAEFVKNHLGPVFEAEGIKTKIIVYDHNADRPDYPLTILNDPEAKKFVDGSAFHLYGGSIEALSQVHETHPDKNLYFTEQWVGGPGNFAGDFGWHIENLIIGAPRNWSRIVLEWNLASDPDYKPHTDGGCTQCLGALTITDSVVRNTAYYIIAHASKFVCPGSVRIYSDMPENLKNVAYQTPDGKIVLIVINTSESEKKFNLKSNGNQFTATLVAGGVATFVW